MAGSWVEASAPSFLTLAGHPLRWRLLAALARSDRKVRELTALVGRPQSLVSYHLARLRADGLVFVRRSSADGRETYYAVDLGRCGELLAAAGAALHPGLRLVSPPAGAPERAVRVLFLCMGNSARSQMAQALMEQFGGERVEAVSAGSHPKPLDDRAVRVMRTRGVDIAGRCSTHLDTYAAERFDYVISLCDRVREVCPDFPGRPDVIHWSIPDPVREGGDDAFERVAEELETRIRFLLHTMMEVKEK